MDRKQKKLVDRQLAELRIPALLGFGKKETAFFDRLIATLSPEARFWLLNDLKNLLKQPKQPATKRFHLVSLRQQAEKRGRVWLEYIHEFNEQIVTLEGFESCVMGVANRFGMEPVVAYDYDKCIRLLMTRDGMTEEDAVDYFSYNVEGAWMGEGTPVFVATSPP